MKWRGLSRLVLSCCHLVKQCMFWNCVDLRLGLSQRLTLVVLLLQVSVLQADAATSLQRCLDTRCAACAGHQPYQRFHCPVCPVSIFKPSTKSKVVSHLEAHFKTAVKFGGWYLWQTEMSGAMLKLG